MDIFIAQSVEIILAKIHPAIRHRRIRENGLVDHHNVGDTVMVNVVQGTFAGGMDNRNTHVNGKNPRACAKRKLPARPASVEATGDGLNFQHA